MIVTSELLGTRSDRDHFLSRLPRTNLVMAGPNYLRIADHCREPCDMAVVSVTSTSIIWKALTTTDAEARAS